MKTKIIICLAMLVLSTQNFAVERWGKISKGFDYDNFRIEQKSANQCRLSIEVENNSKKDVPQYHFEVVASDIHKSVEWRTTVKFDAIQKGESRNISGIVYKCQEDNPYNIVFKFIK